MSARDEALHALAWSLPDVQPAPTGEAAMRGAARGEAPGAWQLCEPCDGNGTLTDRWGRVAVCVTCSGAGRYRVDAFTGQRVGAIDSEAPARGRRATCDRCGGSGVMLARWRRAGDPGMVRCDGCDGAGHVLVPFDADDPAAGKVTFDGSALSRVRARGDWDALEAALTALAMQDRARHRRWVRVRVAGETAVSPGQQTDLVDTDRMLLQALPERLRCPPDVLEAWGRRERYALMRVAARAERMTSGPRKRARVRELVRMGVGVREAAVLAGVSVRTAQRAARELVAA